MLLHNICPYELGALWTAQERSLTLGYSAIRYMSTPPLPLARLTRSDRHPPYPRSPLDSHCTLNLIDQTRRQDPLSFPLLQRIPTRLEPNR
jgi:hypothetical protein